MHRFVTVALTAAAVSTALAAPAQAHAASRPTPACAASALHVSADPRHIPGNGTAGRDGRIRHAALIDFENVSHHACVLRGYPGVAMLGYTGTQVRQARRTTGGSYGSTVHTVVLRPGHDAAAYVEGERSTRPGNCGEHYPALLVTPPNTSRSTRLAVQWPKCFSFDVHPVRALASRP